MRQILCAGCATKKVAGQREVLPASPLTGEPAEVERVVFGTARVPVPEQRVITIVTTGHIKTIPLGPGTYDCDGCNKEIIPGDRCCAYSVWLAGEPVSPWENNYLDAEVDRA
jgi:hypothetical protein